MRDAETIKDFANGVVDEVCDGFRLVIEGRNRWQNNRALGGGS
jgi:hypothetical protein